MKRIIALICLLTISLACLAGCAKLNTKDVYTLYAYDINQGAFWDLGVTLSFTKNAKGYAMRYPGDVEIRGEVKPSATGYTLSCKTDVYMQALQAKQEIIGTADDKLTPETLAALSNVIVAETQIFSYGNYLFASANIDLIRKVDAEEGQRNYTSVEGYYESASDSNKTYLFRDGKVYANATDKDGKVVTDKDGKITYQTTPSARYQLNNGLLVFTVIDASGNDVYKEGVLQRLTYLFGTITFPKDVKDFVYTDDDFSDELKKLAETVAGKSVGVLTKTFYATKNPN